MEYTLQIQTISGIADSEYLDRVAELVYDLDDLIDPLLGLNSDGSISASFCVEGPDPLEAAPRAVAAFANAVVAAHPLRDPTSTERGRGASAANELAALGAGATVGRFTVEPVHDRDAVPA